MSRIKDLTGFRSGKLVVVERDGYDLNGKVLWRCLCDCGAEKTATSRMIAARDIRSCGCTKAFHNLTGHRFGRLIVIKAAGSNKQGKAIWECLCDCGAVKKVLGSSLRLATTTSCGCYQRENASRNQSRHGMYKTKTYKAWQEMKARCYNHRHHKYPIYGGRGIKVCDRWLDAFENFYEDMGECLGNEYSLDRYPDQNGNYEPSNCRWATAKQQANNRRMCNYYDYNGQTLTLAEWAEVTGLPYSMLYQRIRRLGWSIDKALTSSKKINQHG